MSSNKEIQRVLKQEQSRGKGNPLTEESYNDRLSKDQLVTDLLRLPLDRYREALIRVAGLQVGTWQYDQAIQAWHELQLELKRLELRRGQARR